MARGLSDSVPPVTLSFLRGLTVVIVLIPFGMRGLCRNMPVIRKHLGYLALSAFLGVTLSNTLIYVAAHTSQALNLSLLTLCSPIFVAIFARLFLHDTLTIRRIAGLLMATVGAVLLITGGQVGHLKSLTFAEGNLWMLVQAASFALYCILVQVKPAEISQGTFLSSMFVLGWLLLVPWFVWEISGVYAIRLSETALMAIIYLAVGPSLLAYLCWNRAIKMIGPVRTGLVYYCIPLFSGIEAYVLLNEPVHWVHALSGALILAGVVIATWE